MCFALISSGLSFISCRNSINILDAMCIAVFLPISFLFILFYSVTVELFMLLWSHGYLFYFMVYNPLLFLLLKLSYLNPLLFINKAWI